MQTEWFELPVEDLLVLLSLQDATVVTDDLIVSTLLELLPVEEISCVAIV